MDSILYLCNNASKGKRNIYIRGFSQNGFLLSTFFIVNNISFSGYIDSDPLKFGSSDYYGNKCFSPKSIALNSLVFCIVQSSSAIKAIKKEISETSYEYIFLSPNEIFDIVKDIDDKRCLEILTAQTVGYVPNLESPRTFNEKMQWLKLYDRRRDYSNLVDKYEVKSIIAQKIGNQYVIPTLGVWSNFDDINLDNLPNSFVLKCTHDSGSVYICKDKKEFDRNTIKKKFDTSLKTNYFYMGREYPYKNIKPRIIAEPYIKDDFHDSLSVYKIFNFNGKPTLIQTITNDKTRSETIDYFDTEWNRLELRQNYPNSTSIPKRPKNLPEMVTLAQKLSKGFPFIRTDFYSVGDRVYFSEFTFYSDAGFAPFEPFDWDRRLGDLIPLSDRP